MQPRATTRLRGCALLFGIAALSGCALATRQPPPPALVNAAAPEGFSPNVRLVTVDRSGFARALPQILGDLHRAAGDAPIQMLALSGGGAYAAFGAGALVGLAQGHRRPQFTVVTGVSAGALIAPFAFLGPAWDAQLRADFTSGRIERLQRAVSRWSIAGKILLPRVADGSDPLAELVDHTYTDAMIDAIAREAASGRKLVVATTDLDSQETVLWDMTAIAAHGGPAAYRLFRQVMTASASVPGVFPPVMIRVREGDRTYAEMHVDGSVTTPLFVFPLAAQTLPNHQLPLAGGTIYVIVDGRLAMRPRKVPINTFKELKDSFSAQLTYKTRDALGLVQALAQRAHMHFRLTSIPVGYPAGSFLGFGRQHLRQLFAYGEACAASGLLWTDLAGSVERNIYRHAEAATHSLECPAAGLPKR